MQTVIQKLITAIQLPLDGPNMPKNRTELLQVLENDLKLTSCILSSMIEFKRSCLEIIQAQNNFGLQEDDNYHLETQSSLDGEESKSEVNGDDRHANSTNYQIEEEKEETKDQNHNRGTRQTQVAGDRSFLDQMITNKVYGYCYYKEILERQSFLKFLVVLCPEHLLSRKILELLWEILV